jgi:uncharacterized protein DUF5985
MKADHEDWGRSRRMRQFLLGMIGMSFAVAGLFFLRFWRETRDRFFALFALAFFVLAANRVGLVFMVERQMKGDYLYWVRLLAFVIIIVAIVDKNRSRNTAKQ